jgi:hypothetical protein
MTNVTLHIFEDAYTLGNLKPKVDLPRQECAAGTAYRFDWHSAWHTFDADGKRMNSGKNYKEAAHYLKNDLSGPAILFFDLQMHDSDLGRAVDFDPDLIADETLGWLKALYPEVEDRSGAVEKIKTDLSGILLALVAASNPNWQGVIVFASQRANIDIDGITKCTDSSCRGRISWLNARLSMSPDDINRAPKVNEAIDAFLAPRRGPEIWKAGMQSWFRAGGDDLVTPSHDARAGTSQVALIQGYIKSLLGTDELPGDWFVTPQYEVLFESLKGLIGDQSACESGASRNLRVGAIPLLMAAYMVHKGSSINWFLKYKWSDGGGAFKDEILSHRTRDSARQAVLRLGEFLFQIGTYDGGSAIVRDVGWVKLPGDPQSHLYIDLDVDPLARGNNKHRNLLQAFYGMPWGVRRGGVMEAYAALIDAAVRVEHAQLRLLFSCYSLEVNGENDRLSRVTRLDFRKHG